ARSVECRVRPEASPVPGLGDAVVVPRGGPPSPKEKSMTQRHRLRAFVTAILVSCVGARAVPAAAGFVEFESGQVRPLALSPDGTRLYAVNTPDDRLEIFTVGPGGLAHAGSVPVGLEPVAVAARTDGEVWVVNHLSDSVN